MATKPDEAKNPEKGIQPSQGGRGLDQGGPRTELQRKQEEAAQASQAAKDKAGSNAPHTDTQTQPKSGTGLPNKYNLKPEEEKKRDKNTKAYILGDVGDTGQSLMGKVHKRGDEVWLTPEECKNHREHGVPLIEVKDEDKPQEAA